VRPVPFVGREQQLQFLDGELERAQTLGRVALMVGEPGIGKSRLLNELGRRNSRRVTVLSARGSPVSTAIPFSVFVEAIESHLRRLDPAEVLELGGRRLVDLKEIFPSIAVALETTHDPIPSRLRILEAIRSLLEALAASRPVILAIDDLHQADPSSWECLNYLSRNPPAARVLIVAAVRSEELFGHPQLAGLVATLLNRPESGRSARPMDALRPDRNRLRPDPLGGVIGVARDEQAQSQVGPDGPSVLTDQRCAVRPVGRCCTPQVSLPY
jgi:predicted ATPase